MKEKRRRRQTCVACQKTDYQSEMVAFTANPERRKIWLKLLGGAKVEKRLSETFFTSQFLCRSHFSLDAFDAQRRVKPGAFPFDKQEVSKRLLSF